MSEPSREFFVSRFISDARVPLSGPSFGPFGPLLRAAVSKLHIVPPLRNCTTAQLGRSPASRQINSRF